MRINAHLYMNDVLQKVLSCDHRARTIRIANMNLMPRTTFISQENIGVLAGHSTSIFVYELKSMIGPQDYRYEFIGIESQYEPPWDWGSDSIDIGFQDPDENVNLDKLKFKMRDNKDMKQQLTKYYRRR